MPCSVREDRHLPSGTQVGLLVGLLLAPIERIVSEAGAQSLQGIVLDAATRAPMSGATIQLTATQGGSPRQTTSDSLGSFAVMLTRAGVYTLTATRLGYLQHKGDTIRIGESELVSVEIRLDRTALPLRPVLVTARYSGLPEGFEARRTSGFGRFITRTDIDSRRASNASDLLRGLPGIVLTSQRRGPGSTLQMRGTAGLCQPAIWIDGVYVAQFAGVSIDNMLSPLVLEAAEVYNSATTAPIQYRTGNCGVVLFWTRRGGHEEQGRTKWWKIALGVTAAGGLALLIR